MRTPARVLASFGCAVASCVAHGAAGGDRGGGGGDFEILWKSVTSLRTLQDVGRA